MKHRQSHLSDQRISSPRLALLVLALSVSLVSACSSNNNKNSAAEQVAPDDNTTTPDNNIDSSGGSDNNTSGGTNNNTSGGTNNNTNTDAGSTGITTLTVDASAGGFGAAEDDAANKWAYVDLDSGKLLELTDAEASQSTQWDIALKRVDVRTNGGVSGPGSVTAALADAQLRFYKEDGEADLDVFKTATAENELPALERAVESTQLSFESDSNVAFIDSSGVDEDASWWLYNPADHTISANADVWYVVRSADGQSAARFHVTDIQQSEQQISAELYIQNVGESEFSETPVVWTAAIGSESGSACYDFEQMVEVDCESQAESWDLQFEITGGGRSWNAWVNGGEVKGAGSEGAAFGPVAADQIGSFASSTSIPGWFDDAPGGVFAGNDWYAYNLEGNHRIWPNYRVYVVNTGEALYKMQILSYYNEAGSSGMITFRYSVSD